MTAVGRWLPSVQQMADLQLLADLGRWSSFNKPSLAGNRRPCHYTSRVLSRRPRQRGMKARHERELIASVSPRCKTDLRDPLVRATPLDRA